MAVKKSSSTKKKLVRNPNTPSLKSQGAGYSTTNRKGETTFYKSSRDAAGYNDTFQGKGITSTGTPLSTFDASGSVITSDKMQPKPQINLPTPPPVNGLFGVTDGINASLAGSTGGTYDAAKKQIVPPVVDTKPKTATDIFTNYMQSQLNDFNDQKTSEDRLKEQQKMLRPKENLVNSLSGQLNAITTNRDAEMLRLEGQGRGVTESIIGGQQAQISREAAIQAMPIQAQLAIAQDDLESARSYASQLFQAQAQDAQARYNFKKELNASIYNFLNDQEKSRLAQTEKAEDRAFAVEQANRGTLKQLAMQAMEYGQGALSAEIMKLNPASPTFDADYGDVTSRLRKPVAAAAPIKRDTGFDKSGNLIDMQTGEVISKVTNVNPAENLQSQLANADPVSTKQALADLIAGNQITPGARGRIAPSLAVLNSVDELANMNLEGKFTGIGIAGKTKEFVKGLFNMKDPEATTNEQNIDAINLKVQQWASGASLTEQQTEQVNKFTPTTTDSDKTVRTKLNGLYNFMLNQTESELLSEGINVQFPTINLFEISDLYEKASPEQKAIIESTYFKKN